MTTALLAAVLVVLIAARSGRRLLPDSRRPTPRQVARRSRVAIADYPRLLDAISRQVRSGSSLSSAAIDEIDRSSAIGAVADRLAAGDSLSVALTAVHPEEADLALTVQALAATAHLGGPVAATLDEAAAVLRERAAARAERRAHGAQARISARVLTVVPLGFAAWSAVFSQRTRDVYLSTAAGAICAACGVGLNLVGWRWMRRTVGRE
ncbi:MAG: type II secretion system F family protein [Ilumatobacteraceae bacterium]